MSELDINSTGSRVLLVTMEWSGNVVRYCRYDMPLLVGGNTFQPCPEIEINYDEQQGTTTDAPVSLTMKAVYPLDVIQNRRQWPKTTITVQEVDPASLLGVRDIFAGLLGEVRHNYKQKAGACKLVVKGWKSLLNKPLGLQASGKCLWRFGDENCTKDLESLKVTRTVTDITGDTLTLNTAVDSTFIYGFISYDGVRITIKDVSGSTIRLLSAAPPEWSGSIITVYPGCDKTIAGCRVWSNESEFSGYGIKMLSYNPQRESP